MVMEKRLSDGRHFIGKLGKVLREEIKTWKKKR